MQGDFGWDYSLQFFQSLIMSLIFPLGPTLHSFLTKSISCNHSWKLNGERELTWWLLRQPLIVTNVSSGLDLQKQQSEVHDGFRLYTCHKFHTGLSSLGSYTDSVGDWSSTLCLISWTLVRIFFWCPAKDTPILWRSLQNTSRTDVMSQFSHYLRTTSCSCLQLNGLSEDVVLKGVSIMFFPIHHIAISGL